MSNKGDKMNEFHEILKDLVLDTGLSLRQLAKESGVSAMQYSRYLKGSLPTIEVALRIAKYFDCSLDYLFGLDDKKNVLKYKTYNYDLSNFLDKYFSLLKANNISHYKFAKSQSFDESIIRKWKNGKVPRLDVIYTIAYNLGGSIDDLVGRYW